MRVWLNRWRNMRARHQAVLELKWKEMQARRRAVQEHRLANRLEAKWRALVEAEPLGMAAHDVTTLEDWRAGDRK